MNRRALNRALLARQLLLRRERMPVLDAVEHLVGLQAQAPLPPYVGLWSRLEDFDPHELGRMLTDRDVVRMTLMRGTVHLVSVRDALTLRPLVQTVIERSHDGAYGRRMGGATPEAIAGGVRVELARGGGRLTARELARRLVARGIGQDVEAIANATRVHLPLVQVPPRGVWGAGGQARYATLEAWTGRELDPEPSIDEVVLRYLRAFGPASVMDMQTWSGLTKLAPAFERLRDRLVTFPGEDGRELFDLPDAPRPDPETPAPVRFLGEFDNVLLSHADRRRIVPEGFSWEAVNALGRQVSWVLVDGMLTSPWWLEWEGRRAATLVVRPVGELSAADRDEVAAEADRMVAFLVPPTAVRRVRFDPPLH